LCSNGGKFVLPTVAMRVMCVSSHAFCRHMSSCYGMRASLMTVNQERCRFIQWTVHWNVLHCTETCNAPKEHRTLFNIIINVCLYLVLNTACCPVFWRESNRVILCVFRVRYAESAW